MLDYKEVNFIPGLFDKDGNFNFPTYDNIFDYLGLSQYLFNKPNGFFDKKYDTKKLFETPTVPFYSNPNLNDTDMDGISDDVDSAALCFDKTIINDSYLDDSQSINGKNPICNLPQIQVSEKDSDEYYLDTIRETPKSVPMKNAYEFTRFGNTKYSTAQFELTPERNNDYAISISDVDNLDNVYIQISYQRKRFLRSSAKEIVEQTETATLENETATFHFALNEGTKYTIEIENKKSNGEKFEYNIQICQDNWAFAPYGGVRKGRDSGEMGFILNEVYLTYDTICTMINDRRNEDNGTDKTLEQEKKICRIHIK